METAMRNVSINDRTTPSMSPIIKTEPSSLQQQADHLMQDQPLDFSTKVRVQNIIETADDTSVRKVSNDSAIDCSDDTIDDNRAAAPELAIENQSQSFPSQNRLPSMPMPNISTFLPQSSSSMGGMGMFYPPHPVFPNFLPPGFTAGPMWPNPMAAMLQQQEVARKMLSNSGKAPAAPAPIAAALKPPFGNKQSFGKQEMPILGPGGRPFPAMPNFPNAANLSNIPDPNILAEAMKSHEEMFTAYKQQVLSQKAAEDAKKGARRQQAASTTTNGSHSAISTHSNSTPTPAASESFTLSQISEDQTFSSPQLPSTSITSEGATTNGISATRDTQVLSSDEDKNSGSGGSVGEGGTNGIGHASGANSSAGPSLHSSDESLQTYDSRRSLTPAHSSNGELNDITGMRPRSMTLPTQSDSRLLSYSPSPSVLSMGNNSSGPGTPNSKNDRGFRKRARTLPDDQKDEAYWERRRKNNEAAKRSRDSRRAKEDEIAIRAAFLEQENIRLRLELAALKTQTAKLRSELVIFQGPEDQGAGPIVRPADGS